jgi:D-alanyl-D-alanine carboxypeptidase
VKKTSWWVAAVLVLGIGCGGAEAPDRAEAATSSAGGGGASTVGTGGGGMEPDACPELRGALQATLDDTVASLHLPGAAARAFRDDCVWEGATGVASRASMAPMTADALYRIGSSTKTFVAAALLVEVAAGQLSLDATLDTWLPDFPGAAAITLRQVLSHQSGIYNYTDTDEFAAALDADPTAPHEPAELVGWAAAYPPYFGPGDGWEYSNTNFVIAGMVLEAVTGESAGAAIRERVLAPLGLTRTWLDGEEADLGPLAKGYYDAGNGAFFDVTEYMHPSLAWTAGAIASCNGDVERFYRALLGGELFGPDQLAELEGFVDLGGGWGYGLGLFRFPTPAGDALGHGGDIPGYSSDNRYYVNLDAGITHFVDELASAERDQLTLALEAVLLP